MSCCDRTRPVNPRRLGEQGRWVLGGDHPSRGAGCVHTWEYSNALGIIGGPVVKACTGCGESHHPAWAPVVPVRAALPAPASFLVGESEWVTPPPKRGEAA